MPASCHFRSSVLFVVALLVGACGGGGGGGGASPGTPTIPPGGSGSNTPPTTPPQNHPPNILVPMRSDRVIAGRPVHVDLIDTPIFSDPDGDPLAIVVDWDFQSGTPGTWNGLRIVGDQI